jgi:hypothetical protein
MVALQEGKSELFQSCCCNAISDFKKIKKINTILICTKLRRNAKKEA